MKKEIFLLLLLTACNSPNSSNSEQQTSPQTTCVEQVIAIDESLGKIRNHACENGSLSESILDYTKGMDQIDFKDCPTAFTKAFNKHKTAWKNMLQITDKYPDLRGEMHVLFDSLETTTDSSAFKIYLKDIWDTWGEVENAMLKN